MAKASRVFFLVKILEPVQQPVHWIQERIVVRAPVEDHVGGPRPKVAAEGRFRGVDEDMYEFAWIVSSVNSLCFTIL